LSQTDKFLRADRAGSAHGRAGPAHILIPIATRTTPKITEHSIRLHGHEVCYRTAGDSGPFVLLVHGITGNGAAWDPVTARLAREHRVLVPDLLGHGTSAKPRGDYSLGAFAAGLRDLMIALGEDNATVVGHSLGGGVAMQFAYQFPQRVDRLALVSSGGLGREVNLILRAAALPGAEQVLPLLTAPWAVSAGAHVAQGLAKLGLRVGADLVGVAEGFASLRTADARAAFVHTVRAVIDPGGQRVNATDRLYLAAEVPTLLLWGEHDPMIPVAHGRAAHAAMPGSRLEVFENSGHFPFKDDPERFADVLADFIAGTEPARIDDDRTRALLRARAADRSAT
jgi:pimeloyl-ACP methyl ester carboxylesterase